MTDKINDGGPAFPESCTSEGHSGNVHNGMSLRDWYAGMALQGQISATPEIQDYPDPEASAIWAYKYADAMLKARAK